MFIVGNFNLNVLDFNTNKKVQNFVNLMFLYGMIPTIHKLTRVTKTPASAFLLNTGFKTGIIKTDVSDDFPIFIVVKNNIVKSSEHQEVIKHCYNENFVQNFKESQEGPSGVKSNK